MKKLLVIHSGEGVGGGEVVSTLLSKSLDGEFNIDIFVPKYHNPLLRFLAIIKSFFLRVKNSNPDIIHCHGIKAAFFFKISYPIFFIFNIKPFVVYTVHGVHYLHKNFFIKSSMFVFEFLTNRLFVDALVCVGRDDFNFLRRVNIIYKDRIFLIRNGINIPRSVCNMSTDKKKINILSVMRLSFPKDPITIVKSIALLRQYNIVLYIVGDGPLFNKLQRLIVELNIEDKVKLVGFKDNVSSFFYKADIFVLSTKWEGLPLSILEAMAYGVPVIASNVHGVSELVSDRYNGFLFDYKNEHSLADKLLILYNNGILRREMGLLGRHLVETHYSSTRMISEYRDLYYWLIKNENSSNK